MKNENQQEADKAHISSVGKALSILESFDSDTLRLSLADLSRRTGFYKSTILRLIKDLQDFGYIQRDGDGKYLLGWAPLRLGDLYRRSISNGWIIQTCVQQIVERTGESVAFYIPDGDSRICLYRSHSHHLLRTHVNIGDRVSLASGGSPSRIILAFTATNLTDTKLLEVRERGYCFSVGERVPDVSSVSLPIFLSDGKFTGALTISGAITRFDEKSRIKALQIAQKEIIRYGLRYALG